MRPRVRILLTALAASLAIPVLPAAAVDPTPAVSVTKDRAYYVAGQPERIAVTVTGVDGSPGPTKGLRLSADFPDGTTKVLDESGTSDDTFHFTYTLYANHLLHAEVIDEGVVVASAQLNVVEVANLSTDPKAGFLGFKGAYAVFAKGKSPIFRSRDLTGKVAPRCLRHQVQRRYRSGWRPVTTSACRAEQKAVVDWKWRGKHTSGVKFRVRATFVGDIWNRPSRAAWTYFKFR
jgi:hypothetical protein